ncbi:Aliphatic amidase AmiE [Candidatus Nitrosotalea sp. TS]|uniref:nitrilase-related carbon-nitrogen hydrolase n=1 Tax=Candidatus Nitrosotalea sp. TS TaxID=2341020 RepID=UPI00140BD233|nr:carbon-nitrogen hydrolase family protein [Candidatus Nitrosotalea sp. TS]NHI04246.1 Aliphatic amidase AmiE [Candidatus Nitrosotalea sp. TS]
MTKVTVVQMRADTEKEKNLKKILGYIVQAAKRNSTLCTFPEFMMFYTPSRQSASELASLAEKITGEFVTSISEAARKNSVQVVGTFYEKSPKENRVYDTSFLTDRNGKIVSKYRKIHLYDALGFKESAKLYPGSSVARPIKTSVGKIGMMICYDLRFPEMSRMLASSGSEILVAPSAWVQGKMKEEHWIAINKTRAIENGCYVIAPDQVGNIYCGRSMIVDPFGKVLLDMKKREGVGIADISLDQVKQVRKKLPLLKNRRTDIYNDFRI